MRAARAQREAAPERERHAHLPLESEALLGDVLCERFGAQETAATAHEQIIELRQLARGRQ